MARLTLVVAATLTNGIGHNARLPWRLSSELKYFAQVTSAAPAGHANAVLMGRNTWESIPLRFRPLPRRINVVVSTDRHYQLMPPDAPAPAAPVYLHSSLETALERLTHAEWLESPVHRAFVVGGAALYRDTLALPPGPGAFVDRILLTRIIAPEFAQCDVFVPELAQLGTPAWRRAAHAELQEWVGFEVPEGIQEEHGVQYEFQMWIR
ncbi:uncharacterized protein FIBRA_08576 [Fibroporia radiculosa]|uniref:Dihydrofolate reductase n=1 Tax=Fibroporia radiculosa TaxID=599839 RepID=J4H590_9APHY|nr:uncharacterized protein FIBRA_08576 [Fibroporia radiculosa]CCM06324.1 predicted protein [Fibroporia radiculosa]